MQKPLEPDAIRQSLSAIVGSAHVLSEEADVAPYLEEQRDLFHGCAAAVVRPGSVGEVAAIVRLAAEHRVPVVPQGGNTGLVGGQVPDESGRAIVLSLSRLDRIRDIDAEGQTMVVEAGAVLESVQGVAEAAGLFFPLSLGAEGSCQIGGNIATNAGGTGVLAYGNTRSLVLGLEVVLPDGEIWNGLSRLKKDNTGYDLKQIFIGAEGTLGVVTAAVLKLFPKPRGRAVAVAGLKSPTAAVALLRVARDVAAAGLTGFELMPRIGMETVLRHLPGARDPLANPHPWYVLVEIASMRDDADAAAIMQAALEEALRTGLIADATVAASLAQAGDFWRIRHALAEMQRELGGSIKHDVSVPVARIPEFIDRAAAAVTTAIPGCRPYPFGHVGDGNIHFNVSQPEGDDKAAFLARWDEVNRLVHAVVRDLGGSIAAEHGIGRLKRSMLAEVKSPVEMELMRRLKQTIDPQNIMNPGVIL